MMRKLSHMQRDYAWYNQERMKGNMLLGCGRSEGGWGFNREYLVPFGEFVGQQGMVVYEWRPPSPALIAQITDDARISPVFRPFEDETLHTTNFVASISRELRSQLLADAIPATSFAAGANPIQEFSLGNLNFADCMSDGWPRTEDNGRVRLWYHSDLMNVAYYYLHRLYERIVHESKCDE